MPRVFDKKNVIIAKIDEVDLKSYLVDSDLNDCGSRSFLFPELASVIINAIPEYVFASYVDPVIPQTDAVERLREAAKSIYKIKDFDLMKRALIDRDDTAIAELKTKKNNRGEFGEILLHLLLRDFHETIPLISKVYFKDSTGVPAHGFDAVHISPVEKALWLGESKFYSDSKEGIKALIEDINHHFIKDYLNEQILVIKKNLGCNEIPQRDDWIKKLNESSKLSDQLSIINIPLLCIYPHNIYSLFDDLNVKDAVTCHETNARELKKHFDDNNNHPNKSALNIILLLFPVKDKKELAKMLHEKLWYMQNM